jgi:hypothetical protein
VISCVFHQTIPTDVYPKLFDYRYCYGQPSSSGKEMVAAYSCGIARDTAAKWLRLCDTNGWKRPESPVLRAPTLRLDDCIDNPSLIRFFATQTILTSLVVEAPLVTGGPLHTVVFEEEFPTLELVAGPMLYIPLKCHHGVDAVYVEFYKYSKGSENWKWECVMTPFVVTLGGRVSGVEEEFFSQWSGWSRGLGECPVAVRFAWFAPRTTSSMVVEADYLQNKDGTTIKHPAYSTLTPFSEAANDFWSAYNSAKDRKGKPPEEKTTPQRRREVRWLPQKTTRGRHVTD